MRAKTPTILQIIPQLDTGGAELSVIEMTEAVRRAGGHMLVISQGGRLAAEVTAKGGELIELPAASKNPARIIINGHALAALIAEHHVDLIHARSRAPAWSALMAARNTGIPLVTTYHGAYSEKTWLKNRYNSVMARGDVVIANSGFTADLIRKRYSIAQSRLRVIYRGVDVVAFDPANVTAERVARLRAAWGVSDDQRIILLAARMTRWKGQGFAISAIDSLREWGCLDADSVLVLAGDAQGRDDYLRELRSQVDLLGFDDKVRLVGHCDDMPAAFALTHVAVVASDGTTPEAFGRAAAEAQAAACPVIAADFGAPPETVKASPHVAADDITGWLVPPADADALAVALQQALSLGDSARQALGQRARQHIVDNFTDEAMKRQTLQVYDQLLGSRLESHFSG